MATKPPIVLDANLHKPIASGDTLPPDAVGMPAIKTGIRKQKDVAGCDDDGIAIGTNASTSGQYTIAIGKDAAAPTEKPTYGWNGGVAIGYNAQSHYDGVALGKNSVAYRGIAIGGGAIIDDASFGVGAIAIGAVAKAQGQNAIAIGAVANTVGGVAIGDGTDAPGAVSIGHAAKAIAGGVVIGAYGSLQIKYGTVLGHNAVATNTGFQSIAIGAYSVASRQDAVSFGHTAKDFPALKVTAAPPDITTEKFRALVCVAAAAYTHDAINGEQFNALASAINALGASVSGFTPIALLPAEPVSTEPDDAGT
jgi:hypothetical protein